METPGKCFVLDKIMYVVCMPYTHTHTYSRHSAICQTDLQLPSQKFFPAAIFSVGGNELCA